ncbi:MAG TPA: hypothetical protein IAB38_04475 [Candidatus Onthousia excrementipullorum]|uniref:Uncharacterized protein n=1 Tax=Candidatus Onthousia excrementipullorum TaxID=2840884 RepID=A0A9D1J331_9FIRM|nr:hypothetical protein [Candidatus Onthousia excrementipullorum]
MKRIIEFYKDNNDYIFKENDNKIFKINIVEKILNGLDLYNIFFNDYNINDTFEIIDKTNDNDKKDDKMCIAIFNKVKELFTNIENTLKIELMEKDDKKE